MEIVQKLVKYASDLLKMDENAPQKNLGLTLLFTLNQIVCINKDFL